MNPVLRKGSYALMFAVIAAAFIPVALQAGDKPKKPRFALRGAPRMAQSPANIFFTAELQGGDDMEEYYCPALEWDWDDGAKSTHEADCSPYQAGTEIQRRFTAEHTFVQQGNYEVKVSMKRSDKVIAIARVTITVRPGLGDMSDMPRN
jgi:hypothetical protein